MKAIFSSNSFQNFSSVRFQFFPHRLLKNPPRFCIRRARPGNFSYLSTSPGKGQSPGFLFRKIGPGSQFDRLPQGLWIQGMGCKHHNRKLPEDSTSWKVKSSHAHDVKDHQIIGPGGQSLRVLSFRTDSAMSPFS